MKKEKKPMDKAFRKSSLITFVNGAASAGAMLITLSYISYIFTDLAHVELTKMSLGMSICSIVGLVFSLFSGMLIQKTRSRMGQYRPWLLVCTILVSAGTLLCLLEYTNPMMAFLMITIGYTVSSMAADAQMTALYGMLERFTGGDSDKRNSIMATNMMGSNLGYLVWAALLLPMANAFGAEKGELAGFRGAEIVIAIVGLCGMLLMFFYSKKFDGDNRKTGGDDLGSVGVKEMLAGLFKNKPLLVVAIAEMIKYVGYYLFSYMMVYQCTYTLGSLDLMTWLLTGQSLICALAAALGPVFAKWFRGRKRAVIALEIGCVVSYGVMAVTGGTIIGFIIPFVFANIFEGAYLALSINLYLDAGEWYYDKSGSDTRTFAMSVQMIGGKLGMMASGIGLSMPLIACQYDESIGAFGEAVGITTAEGMAMCTRLTGLLPAAATLLGALVLMLFHHVKDSEMEACIARNAEKDAALYGDMM